MVTITNGIKTFRVTSGSVKLYESMGFHAATEEEAEEMMRANQEHSEKSVIPASIMHKKDIVEEDEGEVEVVEDNEDVAFIAELLEKPLSQWSSEEIKAFVKIKGIDTAGAQKISQVRAIIKAYLEEEQKNV